MSTRRDEPWANGNSTPHFEGMEGEDLRFNPPEIERVAPPAIFTAKRIEQRDFPIHCLPPRMRDAVEAAGLITQRPPAMAATVALAVSAGVFGATYRYLSNHYVVQPISLFAVISAIPGQGKNETAKLFRSPLEEADQRAIRAHVTAKQRWDGMNAEERRKEPELRPRLESPDLLCNNYTIQALGRKLSRGRPAMMQIMTEGAMLTGGWSGNRDNKVDTLAQYNNLWDAEGIDNGRMGEGRSFKTAVGRIFSKLIMGQSMMVDWILDAKSAYGYTTRLLICSDDRDDREVYEGNYQDLRNTVGMYNSAMVEPLRQQGIGMEYERTQPWELQYVIPTAEAERYFEQIRADDRAVTAPDILADITDLKAQWQRRRAYQAARIAAVLACYSAAEQGIDGALTIEEAQAEEAMEIATWYHDEIRRLVDMSGDTEVAEDAKRAWGMIRDYIIRAQANNKPDETPNIREVLRRVPFSKDPERKDRVIARLETEGAISRALPEPGKRSARWNVHWRWD